MRSADFIDSIGVNAHLNDINSSYGTSDVAAQMAYLGIDNIRDAVGSDTATYVALGEDGIKFDVITGLNPTLPLDLSYEMAQIDSIAPYVISVEGPNEVNGDPITYDGETGVAAADAFQADLYNAVHSDPNLQGVDVLPFSLSVGDSVDGYGNVTAYADEGNVHGYASDGVPPYYMLSYAVSSITTVVGKPVVMSETGYYTLMNNGSGVTQYVQSVWLMDSLLENAANGVAMTYLYQLEDDSHDDPTNPEDNYGLFNVDGTPKEAAVDLHNLTTILADDGPDATTFTPGTLDYNVAGLPDYAFQELFSKSDGSFDIALWSEPQFFNGQTDVTDSVPLMAVTVTFSGDYDITVFDPVTGTDAVESRQDANSITVALGTDPLIVSVQSATAVNQSGSDGNPTMISSGGAELLSGGDNAAGDVVSGGGTLVLAGDTISNGQQVSAYLVMVPSETGGIQVQSGGEIDTAGAVVAAGGSVSAGFGGVLSGSVLSDGGLATVDSGGIALNTVVSSGGFVFVLSGGLANGTTVEGGGVMLLLPGAADSGTVDNGGLVISNGALVVSGDPTVAANAYSLSGTSIGAGEEELVLPYGSVSATTVTDGGQMTVYGGGIAQVAEIGSGGLATIHSGGSATGITVDAGGLVVIAGGGAVVDTFLGVGGTLDLPDLQAGGGAWARLDAATNILTVSGGGGAYTQTLAGSYTGEYFTVADDGAGGSRVEAVDGTPCYCRGTNILTDAGERPVETLRIGDRLVTHAGARRAIRWIGRRSYAGRFIAGRRDVLPVVIRAGALDDGVPRRDLHVSPLHAMYLEDVLIPASALVNGQSIVQPDSVDFVEYFHVELDSHDIILAEGAPSETFIDDDSRGMFLNAAQYRELYPDHVPQPPQYCAPRLEDGAEVERLRQRLAARAGRASVPVSPDLAPDLAPNGAAGTLQGYLDMADRGRCFGWARDAAAPDEPVRLLILDNGVVIADLVAGRHRADLADAGIGNGCFSFELAIPGGLAPEIGHVIEVVRHRDRCHLSGSPWRLAAQPAAVPDASWLAAEGLGPDQGHVDLIMRERVVGWARDLSQGEAPVALVVLDNGTPVARVLANRYREDVERAGIGRGLHGFEVAFPGGLSPLTRHVITVRRERDGAAIAGAPNVIAPASGFDPAVAAAISQAVGATLPDGESASVLSFLLAQRERLLRRMATGTKAARLPARRALVIDACSPRADRDAGSQAVLSHMRALQQLGYAVSFVAAQETAPPPEAVAALAAANIACGRAGVPAAVEDVLRRGGFDLVYLHRAEIASRYLALARKCLPRAVILYGVADLHHLRLARQAEVEGRPDLMAASRRMRRVECTAAWSADAVITHSADEAAWLRRNVPEARVHVVPWAVESRPIAAPFKARSGIGFIGNYDHAPNVDAALWLVDEVMPLVWRRDTSITCRLVGSNMAESVRRLAGERVMAVGQVADLAAEVFDQVRLTVAPLRYGAGVKGKVVASLAAGVPCVMSAIAAEGLALPPALRALVGRDAPALAALICRQHANRAANMAAAAAGTAFIAQGFDQENVASALGAAIQDAGRPPACQAITA